MTNDMKTEKYYVTLFFEQSYSENTLTDCDEISKYEYFLRPALEKVFRKMRLSQNSEHSIFFLDNL